jgi:murein DD-endopeptidase MepM/ murein hydrolase activator NlpD
MKVFPVARRGRFTNDWGGARSPGSTGGTGRHQGIDIFSPASTAVVAVEDGVITKMGPSKIGGNRIWLNGTYYYAHLLRFAKGLRVGTKVKAGQVIGFVGTTGDAKGTPPHLHFGYDPNGTQGASWANPYEMLTKAPKVSQYVPEQQAPPQEAAPVQPEPVDLPDLVAPPGPGLPEGGQDLPGTAEIPYEPQPVVELWRMVYSQPFISPETQRIASRFGGEDGTA